MADSTIPVGYDLFCYLDAETVSANFVNIAQATRCVKRETSA